MDVSADTVAHDCRYGTSSESAWKQLGFDSPRHHGLSLKSDHSMYQAIEFQDGDLHQKKLPETEPMPSLPLVKSNSIENKETIDDPRALKQLGFDSPRVHSDSLKSDQSMHHAIEFQNGDFNRKQLPVTEGRPSVPFMRSNSIENKEAVDDARLSALKQLGFDPPRHHGLSLKSDHSMYLPINFQDGDLHQKKLQLTGAEPLDPFVRSKSIENKENADDPCPTPHRKRSEVLTHRPVQKTNLDFTFTVLEEKIVTFVKTELKKMKKVLESDDLSETLRDVDEVVGGEAEKQRLSNRDAILEITVNFLRGMSQEDVAESLQKKSLVAACQRKLKSHMARKFSCLFEGVPKAGSPALLRRIYTELSVTWGESKVLRGRPQLTATETVVGNNLETTVRLEDIFGPSPDGTEPFRTVVIKGVAGVGKSVLTQKFILDWAEERASQHLHFLFPFTFRELNLFQKKKLSLLNLLHHVFPDTKEAGISSLENFHVLFVLDGLDECRLPLDFNNSQIITDIAESASVGVLLTNLVRGTLLPTTRVWITSRPAAATQIPAQCVHVVTEVRGFAGPQVDEYFRKRFQEEEQAAKILAHIKSSRSLLTMCRVPVFCWIAAAVLQHLLKIKDKTQLPSTLTEMYIHFLVVQTIQRNAKYHSSVQTDTLWSAETKETILELGKLAFDHLDRGSLVFDDAELKECGLDIRSASVFSGLVTELNRDERGLNQDTVFCFVHNSIQEFLAALYVFSTFVNKGVDLLKRSQLSAGRQLKSSLKLLCQRAVDRALESRTGHLDLFVRFLLGLSLETNQRLLRGLLLKTGGSSPADKEALIRHIKSKIDKSLLPETNIHLLHCLNELHDHSVVEEIQRHLRSGNIFRNRPSPGQWSALAFILLSSQEDLTVLDLRKYCASDEALIWLRPVVQASKMSILSGCKLSWTSCEALNPVLRSSSSNLVELDLSDNDLQDGGAMLLSAGLRSPHCRLEVLRLSGCQITEKGCALLALALESESCHLRELDLSFNDPGESGVALLSASLNDPLRNLKALNTEHSGSHRLKPSPFRYFRRLSLDQNTADRNLGVSDDHRVAELVKEKLPYPDHPERFDGCKQVLCTEGLSGRCYWEVQWHGVVTVGVACGGIQRRGEWDACCLGRNGQSWSVLCSAQGYTPWHGNEQLATVPPPPADSRKMGVYLDCSAGTLSFFCFPFATKYVHVHTFHAAFTEPLYAAFGFEGMQEQQKYLWWSQSSVHLCDIEE